MYTFTVYPKKYAHGFCFAVLCCGDTLTDFPKSIRLTSLALWQSNDCPSASKATPMNMDKYFMWPHYERLHNHNKAKHNKTVCIFLGIYCSSMHPDQLLATLHDAVCEQEASRPRDWSYCSHKLDMDTVSLSTVSNQMLPNLHGSKRSDRRVFPFFTNSLQGWYPQSRRESHINLCTVNLYWLRPCPGLTHWSRNKMAAFLQTTLPSLFLYGYGCIVIPISIKFVPNGVIDYNPALVQIMDWCQPDA